MHQVSHCPSFALGTLSLTLVAATSLRAIRSVLASPALWAGTTIPGATVTKTGVHATETVAPPGPVAFGTTPKCGKCYQVNKGDYCQLIALNFTITVSLFEAINPQIDAGCSNLSPGLYYCVLPTADWNQTTTTTTSSYQTAPAPAPSGTTGNCYEVRTQGILGLGLTNLAPVVCGTIGRLLRQDRIGVWHYYGAVAAVESRSQG